MLYDNLGHHAQHFSEYTELRVQENRETAIVLVNGDLVRNHVSSNSGVSARSCKNGVWGFASHPEINNKSLKGVVESATKSARFLNGRIKNAPSTLASRQAEGVNDFSTKKNRWSQQELLDFLNTVDQYILANCKKLSSRTSVIQTLDMEKSLITSDQSVASSMIPRAFVYLDFVIDDKDGQPISLHDVVGGLGQFEDAFSNPELIFPKIDGIYEQLLKKAEGVFPKAGIQTCVLDASLAGILAHEAIGHTTEADFVMGGSVAADLKDQLVASPMLSLVDFANTAFGKTCPVPVYIDDEGVAAEDAVIIENGVLKTYMHNKDSALQMGAELTGNARAMDFYDEPLIRMRNTSILPGEHKLEEMIASMDDGYYLMKSSNGQADATSEFMFGVIQGYEVKNGKLGAALKDTTISGVAFDVLKSVTMISDDLIWESAGMCGKKQSIPVGMGGPAIKCQVNIGGK